MGFGWDEEWFDEFQGDTLQDDFDDNIWTTVDHQKIPLIEMTTRHIRNCIRHIKNSPNGADCCFGYGGRWLPKLELELLKRKGE